MPPCLRHRHWRSAESQQRPQPHARESRENANEKLERANEPPHALRGTFASLLVALGRDPRYVMAQLGHTDPKFTLKVCAQTMAFGDDQRARLEALVSGATVAGPPLETAEKVEIAATGVGDEESVPDP